jgi:hypothetical protein
LVCSRPKRHQNFPEKGVSLKHLQQRVVILQVGM